jgi:hypothetical protein
VQGRRRHPPGAGQGSAPDRRYRGRCLAGGLLGNQIGGGTGKKIATVAGAVGGGYAGNKVQEGMQERDTYTTTQTRCNTVNDISDKVVGYDVRYSLDGKEGKVRMDRDPGNQIPWTRRQVDPVAESAGPVSQASATLRGASRPGRACSR